MSFGKNPYVEKAQMAEQKADDAPDDSTRERLRREAAHEWDRAAAREKPGKKRDEYVKKAEANREAAENGGALVAEDGEAPAGTSGKVWN